MTPELQNSRFMKAVRREQVDTTPLWIMRQAGRYLPEYMAVRSKVTFLELCQTPELAAEVTLTAQSVLGVDAAILFADLLPILQPMGFDLEYVKGEGPVIHNPIMAAGEIDRVKAVENIADLGYVFDAVKLIRRQLPADIPLIGFAGAPFTLASYAIEGGSSKNYVRTKSIMYNDEPAWQSLMEKLVPSLVDYLNAQIAAGCQVVQIFDSWAGSLSPGDYTRYVLPYLKQMIDGITPGTPVINFLTGNPCLLPIQKTAGGDVIGLDWRINLKEGWELVGHDRGVQGNLDPVSIYADLPVLKSRIQDVLDQAENRPGHIFNLGHGVMPDMNPDNVKAVVEMVHELGAR